jgi:NAD(P)H dehydrogenase (quinone)
MIFRRLEERLRAIPVTTILVRSSEHMQNWLRQLRPARERGVLPSLHHPVTRPFPIVSAFDVGMVAADLLAAPCEASTTARVLHVEGPHRYAANDVATALGKRLARDVSAQAVPREQWASALTAAKLGESYAQLVCELQDAHNAGLIEVEPGGEVRRGATELDAALAEPSRIA